jgi:hypothetical protein
MLIATYEYIHNTIIPNENFCVWQWVKESVERSNNVVTNCAYRRLQSVCTVRTLFIEILLFAAREIKTDEALATCVASNSQKISHENAYCVG